jgi:hypothetical protein
VFHSAGCFVAGALLGPSGELFVILRDTEDYCLGVGIRHLHGYRSRLLGPASPIFRIAQVYFRCGSRP